MADIAERKRAHVTKEKAVADFRKDLGEATGGHKPTS
jgi:hypothetical protein